MNTNHLAMPMFHGLLLKPCQEGRLWPVEKPLAEEDLQKLFEGHRDCPILGPVVEDGLSKNKHVLLSGV